MTTRTFSILTSLCLVLCASNVTFAQSEPTPATNSETKSSPATASQTKRRVAVKQREEPKIPGEETVIARLELKDATVLDGARMIAEASGLNVVSTIEAGEKQVSILLSDVTARQAIEILAQVSGLWFRTDPDTRTVRIMTIEEYQDDLVVYRKDVTRVFQLQHPNAVSAAIAIQNLYPGRVMLSLTPINDDQLLAITGQTSLAIGGFGGAGGVGGGAGGFGGGGQFGGGRGGFGGGGYFANFLFAC